jgi:hypothetical protein
VTIRGVVELSTDEDLQEEVSRRIMRRYFGDGGDANIDVLLQDGKPGKNRVVVKVKPEKLSAWDLRKLEGSAGYLGK